MMGIVDRLRTFVDWLNLILNRRIAKADDFRLAIEQALEDSDSDSDGYISVRELVSFTMRCLR